jgi:hypothetical protein
LEEPVCFHNLVVRSAPAETPGANNGANNGANTGANTGADSGACAVAMRYFLIILPIKSKQPSLWQ